MGTRIDRGSIARLALLALIWGSGFLWIKLALRGFTPVQIVLARLLLGVMVLAPIALVRQMPLPSGRRIWAHLVVAALLANAVPYTLFGIGEQTVGSNVAGVLNATTPLWTMLVAVLAGTDRAVNGWRAAGIASGFAGTVLIFTPWESATEIASWGGLACLAASASYGLSYVYMGRHLAGRGIPPIMLSTCQLAVGTALLILALPFGGLTVPTWSAVPVSSLVILGTVGTGLAYVLNYRLISDLGSTAASTTTYLLPVVAVVLGALVLKEPVTAPMVAGMILVLAGIALVQLRLDPSTARTTLATAGAPPRDAHEQPD
ncbi:drug/metabolite transporter (DMT)-like permease [Micromonospora pisi]|uniref:Drug/metabolite transporter (DMT)-like permease n=1 Tax=Micromonospora pisi TaxID=589240 RepID=A0A495JUY5_9ACTN|nr:DMT family transporter [Micromonospora pisi]RKR92355.1 drug/metabolite transporter (DMT)-like permease [Micromonospora pisi]